MARSSICEETFYQQERTEISEPGIQQGSPQVMLVFNLGALPQDTPHHMHAVQFDSEVRRDRNGSIPRSALKFSPYLAA